MTWYVGPIIWAPGAEYVPLVCREHGCRLWMRWQDDGPRILIQHNGDPLSPPSEAILEQDRRTPGYTRLGAIKRWAERVHAYEDANSPGDRL